MSPPLFWSGSIFVITLIVANAAISLAADSSSKLSDIAEEISHAVVPLWRINPERNHSYEIVGTGFWVTRGGILATASHVIADGSVAIPSDEGWITCDILRRTFEEKADTENITWDIAALKVDRTYPRIHPARLSDKGYFRMGYAVAAYGFFEHGQGYTIGTKLRISGLLTRGIVSSAHALVVGERTLGTRFVLDITAGPGSSGGPVFDPMDGKVIGILSGGKSIDVASPRGDSEDWELRTVSLGIITAEPVIPLLEWLRNTGCVDY
jgi:S1-C subfamily serine protease